MSSKNYLSDYFWGSLASEVSKVEIPYYALHLLSYGNTGIHFKPFFLGIFSTLSKTCKIILKSLEPNIGLKQYSYL